jgi:hypothetical protein
VIYWNAAVYSYYEGAPKRDALEATMRLLLSVEHDAFGWTLRGPMPRRLHEAFAPHLIGSGSNRYRVRLLVRRPAPTHP